MSDVPTETFDDDAVPLTAAQRAELEHRWLDYQANPDEGVPWEDVRKALLDA